VTRIREGLIAALLGATAALGLADVVVLKGGTVVPLKQAWVRRGNTAYLTRADGTLLSVPVSEIDREATAKANQASPSAPAAAASAPASTPAEAVRATSESPKARVRITDADVSHPLDLDAAAAPGEGKEAATGPGGARVEVADYTQELVGEALAVKGSLRNPGQATAENVRMSVAAIDEKGQPIDGAPATLSKGSVGAGQSVDFTASLKVGSKTVASIRFNPQWTQPKPPPEPTPRPGTAAAAAAAKAAVPTPVPTPYGQGTLYAAPVASAPSKPPADGKTGYIPGATSPDNQPKPPNR
jgi:hypothetical protein